MRFFVYILYSEKFDVFYKGQTQDIKQRLILHNNGKVSFTKRYLPWKLLWFTEKDSRAEAMLLERKLKNLSKARLIQFIEKYS